LFRAKAEAAAASAFDLIAEEGKFMLPFLGFRTSTGMTLGNYNLMKWSGSYILALSLRVLCAQHSQSFLRLQADYEIQFFCQQALAWKKAKVLRTK